MVRRRKCRDTSLCRRACEWTVRDDPSGTSVLRDVHIAYLLNRTIRVEADLVDQLFNSSEKRLARLLLLLANFGKEEKPEPILAKISQETLAEMIGMTRSRVSFFMLSSISSFCPILNDPSRNSRTSARTVKHLHAG